MPSASTGSTSSVTTGAAPWRWQVAGRHPERLRTLTSLSTPHPAAFRRSMQEGEQRDKSGYMLFFRSPEAEPFFLDDDAAGLRALYTASGLTDDAVEEYVRVLTQPGAMTGALNWYRAADVGLVEGLGPITMPTMYVWSTYDPALGREAAEGDGGARRRAVPVRGPRGREPLDRRRGARRAEHAPARAPRRRVDAAVSRFGAFPLVSASNGHHPRCCHTPSAQ